jgi:hypothetical protein
MLSQRRNAWRIRRHRVTRMIEAAQNRRSHTEGSRLRKNALHDHSACHWAHEQAERRYAELVKEYRRAGRRQRISLVIGVAAVLVNARSLLMGVVDAIIHWARLIPFWLTGGS